MASTGDRAACFSKNAQTCVQLLHKHPSPLYKIVIISANSTNLLTTISTFPSFIFVRFRKTLKNGVSSVTSLHCVNNCHQLNKTTKNCETVAKCFTQKWRLNCFAVSAIVGRNNIDFILWQKKQNKTDESENVTGLTFGRSFSKFRN